ncbi:hypothetical protein F5Y17DRAFT_453612, partial [Xylariaceae sp. FL0594]
MHGKGFDSALKWFATPVVTQLFSYMADKVSDTATYIQARLSSSSTSANPSVVYYSVCVPNLHVMGDDDDWLHSYRCRPSLSCPGSALATAARKIGM